MNIVFFHRLDLVHLYAPVSKILEKDNHIKHVAFSKNEVTILNRDYNIHDNIINLSELRDYYLVNPDKINYSISDLDAFIRKNTGNRFNYSSSIILDRTYVNYSISDINLISLSYYQTWSEIFNKFNPDLFFHEPPAIFCTHLASMFCVNNHAKYLTQIHVIGKEVYQWLFLEGDNAFPTEIKLNENRLNLIDLGASDFQKKFFEEDSVLLGNISINQSSNKKFKVWNFSKRLASLSVNHLINYFKGKPIFKPSDHIEKFVESNKSDYFTDLENLYGRMFQKFISEPVEGENYYFFPLHLEPEAVVLYYADGWYTGQIKLVENIAMQLPPNVFLYVKDHPHGGNYRNVRDYKALTKIPNVKLIDPQYSGKSLIKKSKGVITINGTAGFEALLLNKHVICFGNAFYSGFKGVNKIKHVRDLAKVLYDLETADECKIDLIELNYYLNSLHPGFVSYFANRQNVLKIDSKENAQIVASGINKLIAKIKESKPNEIS